MTLQKNSKLLEDQYDKKQAQVSTTPVDLSAESIASWITQKVIELSPEFQRRERWDRDRQSQLIESFLLNIPVPPMYFSSEFDQYMVIDGKQRITAIDAFINRGEALSGLKKLSELNGWTYNELPQKLKNKLMVNPSLRAYIITASSTGSEGNNSPVEVKYDLFHRLNTGGVPLEPQEIRNAIFRGPLNDLIGDLAKNEFFLRQLKAGPGSQSFKKMKDHEYVLRFLLMSERWRHIDGNLSSEMDSFMQKYKGDTHKCAYFRTKFNKMATRSEALFGGAAFHRLSLDEKSWRDQQNVALFDAQSVAVCMLNESEYGTAVRRKDEVIESMKALLKGDDDFKSSIDNATQMKSSIKCRVTKVYDMLSSFSND